MPQQGHCCTRIGVIVVLVVLCLTVRFAYSQSEPSSTPDIAVSSGRATESDAPIMAVLGLTADLNTVVKDAIDTELAEFDTTVIDLTTQSLNSIDWPDDAHVIAVGVSACQQAVNRLSELDTQCVLLTEENFRLIDVANDASDTRIVSALVIDQPITRQAQVAQRVYPALSSFSVIAEPHVVREEEGPYRLSFSAYRDDRALAQQVKQAIANTDALVATPVSAIFNRSTLRTVLLTAYGYGKPVIGLSRAYVKAGALITAYTTPLHVFREIAENLRTAVSTANTSSRIVYPRYFSVIDNANVAKSLGLTKLFRFDMARTYRDGDFQQ